VLRIDGPPARWITHHVGPDQVRSVEDGVAVVELPVTNRAAFRAFVLSFLHHAEVLEPAELRADVVAWLEQAS
jgi:predicted DNA-binding transcriptional regulator YafY